MYFGNVTSEAYDIVTAGRIRKALELMRSGQLDQLTVGRHDIEGNDMYISISEYTTNTGEALWEAHRQYLDMQYILDGEERIGIADVSALQVVKPYDEVKDIVFGHVADEVDYLRLRRGKVMILPPDTAHCPGLACVESKTVRKVVVKIRLPK